MPALCAISISDAARSEIGSSNHRRERAIALSSAGSALGGAELLTGMMSFNPTARRFHAQATNVQSAVIGIVASRGDQCANFRWSRGTACVGRNVGD